MTSMKMGDKPRAGSRHALRNYMVAGVAVTVIVTASLVGFNQGPAGQPPVFTPLAGLLLTGFGLLAFVVCTIIYLKRTDEHDLMANLWGCSIGSMVAITLAPAWWILHRSGLVGPVDSLTVFMVSVIAAAAVWTWLRFR